MEFKIKTNLSGDFYIKKRIYFYAKHISEIKVSVSCKFISVIFDEKNIITKENIQANKWFYCSGTARKYIEIKGNCENINKFIYINTLSDYDIF
jgi:hypothetical protein